jgi:hypothetical protein
MCTHHLIASKAVSAVNDSCLRDKSSVNKSTPPTAPITLNDGALHIEIVRKEGSIRPFGKTITTRKNAKFKGLSPIILVAKGTKNFRVGTSFDQV